MLQEKDIASLPFLKKAIFKGSYQGMRFWLQKKEEEEKTYIEAIVWKEPFCYEKTKEEDKVRKTFEFKTEELENITQWLNEQHRKIILD